MVADPTAGAAASQEVPPVVVDPVEAVLRRKISMTGDLQQILERMRYKGIAERMMSKLKTEFVDEEKP